MNNEFLLYKKALKFWGEKSQFNLMIEECAELIKEISKIDRKSNGSNYLKIANELIDVEIMIKQLKIILSFHNINNLDLSKIKEHKLKRLNELIIKEGG